MRGDLDLQDDPDVDDKVAAYEHGGLPVQIADLVDERQAVDPGLARSNAEHGYEGQVEFAEAAWRQLLEQRHSKNRVCKGGGDGGKLAILTGRTST